MAVSLSAWGLEAPQTLQALLDAAVPGATVRLSPGIFEGNVVVKKPVRLVGAGPGTVLRAITGPTLIVSARDVDLQHLSVQGEIAIQTLNRAGLSISHATFQGRQTVLAIGEGAQVLLSDVEVETNPRINELCVAGIGVQNSTLKAENVKIQGRCRRSFDATNSRLQLAHISMTGATATGLQFVESEVEFDDIEATSTSTDMASAFAARSFVKGTGLSLKGGLQGWLQKGGKTALSNVRVEGVAAAGVALIGGSADIKTAELTGPFTQAAFFASDNAQISLEKAGVTRTGAVGVLVNRSDATVTGSRFSGVRFDRDGDFGHAVVGERARISLTDVVVDDAEGAAVYASQPPSSIEISKLALNAVGAGMVTVDGARMSARDVSGNAKGAVAFAGNHSTIELSHANVRAPMGTVECDGATVQKGTEVKLVAETSGLTCKANEIDATWRRLVPRR